MVLEDRGGMSEKLTGPQREMLRSLAQCDAACDKEGVDRHDYWSTGGLGGARVSKALERRGLVRLGRASDGYAGATLTRTGRQAASQITGEA